MRILSLDGGGVRGYYSALLLARLEEARPGFLDGFDLFAGTSTGSIIALGLAMGLPAGEVADMYGRKAPRIFEVTWGERLRDVNGLIGPRYSASRFAAVLRNVFADRRLGDLERHVLVPAFRLDDGNEAGPRRWRPVLFHNLPGTAGRPRLLLRRVALYSSTVPAIFAPTEGYVDGGVFAANPALCAALVTLDERHTFARPGLEQLQLLSIGTGLAALHIGSEVREWGLAQWARPLLGMMLDGGVEMVDYQCRLLFQERYHRLNPRIGGDPIQLDNVDSFERLAQAAAAADLQGTLAWLDRGTNSAK
ncbi:MAG: patatin-like phospholipase family protein [Gammaproteobacteria bacterium]|nr:patatin-like phospholipase family protein [Gammaproteobacteria bacterium]